MAKTIGELDAALSLDDSGKLELEQGGESLHTSLGQLKEFLGGGAGGAAVISAAGASLTLTEPPGSPIGLFYITLDQLECELSIDITAALTELREIRLLLRQGSGPNLVNWDSNIVWHASRAPLLSYDTGSVDLVRLVSSPMMTGQWFGVFEGAWFL